MVGDHEFDQTVNGLPVFDSESDFQDWLEKKFESQGYTAIQEVRPHNSRYRADMILLHDEFGPIGLELKRLTGGTDAGKAHQQIVRQYSGRKYINQRVKRWAFAPYMPKLQYEQHHGEERMFQAGKLEVLEHFFMRYGIGVLNVHTRPYARIKWGTSREYMIPAFPMAREFSDRNIGTHDMEKIDQRIADRLYHD